jgi:hypothetical protein
MKLISMTDFVLECSQNAPLEDYNKVNETFVNRVTSYADFLKTPLNLGMFAPCDSNGVFCPKPNLENYHIDEEGSYLFNLAFTKWKQGSEKVIFKGFEITKTSNYYIVKDNDSNPIWVSWNNSKVVEDLIPLNLECVLNY